MEKRDYCQYLTLAHNIVSWHLYVKFSIEVYVSIDFSTNGVEDKV